MACALWKLALGLTVLCFTLAVSDEPLGAGDALQPEACDPSISGESEECAAQGDALLQHASRMDLGHVETQSLSEDSEAASESEVRMGTVSWTEASTRSWLMDGTVSSASARVLEGGRTAEVTFRHGGQVAHYRLNAFSVFSEGAEYVEHTASGDEKRPLPGVGEPARHFRARDMDNVHGHWASAVIENGQVTGLFQTEEGVVRLEPLDGAGEEAASLLQAARAENVQNPHLKHRFDIGRFLQRSRRAKKPCVKVDGECVHTGGDDLSDGIQHVPKMDPNESEAPLLSGKAAWNGVKWWPGCYRGDDSMQEFKVGAVLDHDGYEEHGDRATQMLQDAFVEASFPYEHQLHIRLTIGHMKIFKSSSGAPSYAVGCSPVLKLQDFKGRAAQDMPSGLGSSHMFTGCGTGYGTVGMAWVGTICRTDGYATGVNQFHKTRDWLTFAHELGHNFNGGHSFEEGQGKTGGIMDYGDGKLNGVYQFNTKYRKQEMCKKMNQAVNSCAGGFQKAPPSGSPTPSPPAPPPPPPPAGSPPSPPGGSPSPPSGGPPNYQVLREQLQELKQEVQDTRKEVKKVVDSIR